MRAGFLPTERSINCRSAFDGHRICRPAFIFAGGREGNPCSHWNDPDETSGFKTEFDPTFVEKILTRAASRVPVLAEAGVNPRRAWAGLYEMTPDHHAIIGPAPNVEGLYFVNGFSGHGVMHSPRRARLR